MNTKNDTIPLLLAFIITGSIVGYVAWKFSPQKSSSSPNISGSSNSPEPTNSSGLISTFAEVANVPNGSFRYGGSTTFAPIRDVVDREIMKALPRFQLIYVDPISGTPGSGKGIEMLLDNQLSLSQSSRSIKDEEEEKAKAKGFNLEEIPVAIDGIAIAVNPNLNVRGLTVSQIKDIYTGKITNWSQVNGPNLPIIPYSRNPKDGGTVEFFQTHVLEKEAFGNNVQYMHDTTLSLREVGKNLGGIYYASAPEVIPQCGIKPLPLGKKEGEWIAPYLEPYIPTRECPNRRNTINQAAFQQATYPITRNIFVIVKKNRQLDEQAGIAYANLLLTQQGQDLIQQAGFVPLR